jgi:hypothetical protein
VLFALLLYAAATYGLIVGRGSTFVGIMFGLATFVAVIDRIRVRRAKARADTPTGASGEAEAEFAFPDEEGDSR